MLSLSLFIAFASSVSGSFVTTATSVVPLSDTAALEFTNYFFLCVYRYALFAAPAVNPSLN